MKKLYVVFLLFGMMLITTVSGQTYTLANTTLMSKGVLYQKYTSTSPKMQELHVLQIDLKDPTVKMQSVKSGNVMNGAAQTVKQMAAGKDDNEHYHNVIGAVNGDFYSLSTFNPENILVPDGQLFADKIGGPRKSVFGITETNEPFIALRDSGFTVLKGGVSRALNRINGSRAANQLVLYNQFRGSSTGTDASGTELKLALYPGASWKVNAPVKCSVIAKVAGVGNMSFSSGQAVLSGNGSEATYLNGFNIGDTFSVRLNVAGTLSNVFQVMGGFPRLVLDGVNTASSTVLSEGGTVEQDTISNNPHTAIGISQDKRTLYMAVVDGRDPATHYGMSMTQFANFMIFLGAHNAVNLDGGGSSTLVANNVVKNDPSDGSERAVGAALLVYSSEQLLDDFETDEDHFNQAPTYTIGTQYTVGIKANSTADRVSTNACSGGWSERFVLNDSTQISTPWTVRLLSGSGLPANNVRISSEGTIGFWLKTNTAQTGATVQVWFDDSDGAEASPPLTIINDGEWHQYNFDLTNFNGTTITTGNGQLTADTVTLDAIVLKQANTATQWTLYVDDVNHDKAGAGTIIRSQNKMLDDFEASAGHFDKAPMYNPGGTFYTTGIANGSTLSRVTGTTDKHRGIGGLKATLIDDASSSANWTVRLLSGSGIPANNIKFTSDGTLSFWMKTSTAHASATVQVWFDDTDGAEASPALSVINDGQWHQYNFDLSNYNGTTITSGNGQLDGVLVNLDAIVLKQNNTSSTWTVYFDDVDHIATGTSSGTVVIKDKDPSQKITPLPEEEAQKTLPVLYPNPNNGSFTIDLKDAAMTKFDVEILDMAGRRIFSGRNYSKGRQINLKNQANGLYIVHAKNGRVTKTLKLIIQKK